MQTWIALFRGINVGGNNIIKMADLKAWCTGLGHQNVQTYIQSGNLVFRSDKCGDDLTQELKATIAAKAGFEPNIMLFPAERIAHAMKENPFFEGEEDPKSLHLYFLERAPETPDLAAMQRLKRPDSEHFRLMGDVYYLHAPDGIGRSKLAEKVEKLLGVSATARNWRTVSKLAAMATD